MSCRGLTERNFEIKKYNSAINKNTRHIEKCFANSMDEWLPSVGDFYHPLFGPIQPLFLPGVNIDFFTDSLLSIFTIRHNAITLKTSKNIKIFTDVHHFTLQLQPFLANLSFLYHKALQSQSSQWCERHSLKKFSNFNEQILFNPFIY